MERLLSASAVGSLREDMSPLDLVIPDQFIDRTQGRIGTFFGDGVVGHIAFADPVCAHLAQVAHAAAVTAGATVHKGGTYVCMEGPAFSTRAESHLYRGWGAHVIGMTNLQEAKLAREAEICYATIALVTDFDAWHPDHDHVTVEMVINNLTQNARTAQQVIAGAVGSAGRDTAHVRVRPGPCHGNHHASRGGPRSHPPQTGADHGQVSGNVGPLPTPAADSRCRLPTADCRSRFPTPDSRLPPCLATSSPVPSPSTTS